MPTIHKLLSQGDGLSAVLRKRAATVQLGWEQRQHHHFQATDSQGQLLQVALPEGTRLRGGDVLVTGEGALIVVEAATQPVMAVTPCPEHGTPLDLLRAVYLLGSRHVPVVLQAGRLLLLRDAALAETLRHMDLIVEDTEEAFEPEAGAVAGHAHHEHSHGPEAAAPARHRPIPIAVRPADSTPHVHGPHCKHGHDHPH